MKTIVTLAIVVVAAAAAAAAQTVRARYDGHQVVALERAAGVALAAELELDVFRTSAKETVVRVSPKDRLELARRGVAFEVLNTDLQASLDREQARLAERPARFDNETWFSDYHTYEELKAWYSELATTNPTFVRFEPSIGKSVEGRDIFAITLTSPVGGTNKPQVFFQGQIHAREWISGSTVNYIVNQLLQDYGRDGNVTALLDQVELRVLPNLNVDGYAYTWTDDRLWRKNRQPPPTGSACYGIDLNRNYDDHWSEAGSSASPCSSNYHGTGPASEPEAYFANAGRIIGAIDFHSSGQLILRPYGWSATDAPDEAVHRDLGARMASAIAATSGEAYTSQKSIALYATSGGASDWFYGAATAVTGIQAYGYTIELRPDEGGQHDIPPTEIIPTGEEIYAAIKVFLRFVLDNPL